MRSKKRTGLNIKQLLHYQVRQDNFFFFKNERRYEKNEGRNNEFLFNFFLLNNKRNQVKMIDEYNT